ncbi:winged helix-turn-helix transcriptional regulator [Brevibacterium casei]|nr:winged helix-turn-helix transcriptional regulator [Brevibacterium casei]
MPRRTTDYRGLTEPNRVRLLGAVQEHPDRSLKELAEAVGLHVNTVRDHLGVLIAEGLVSSRPRPCGTRGRPPDRLPGRRRCADEPGGAEAHR